MYYAVCQVYYVYPPGKASARTHTHAHARTHTHTHTHTHTVFEVLPNETAKDQRNPGHTIFVSCLHWFHYTKVATIQRK